MHKNILTVVGITILFLGTCITPTVAVVTANIEQSNGKSARDDTDWWSMFRHDLQHSGYSTSNAPDTNNVLWSYTIGSRGRSSPAVEDGKVYFGSDDYNLYCLDANTGVYIWSYKTGGSVGSSPAVADGIVYITSWDFTVYAFGSNTPPDKPEIDGPIRGKPGVEYTFVFSTEDPEGDDVSYYIEWEDNTTTGWTDYYESGEQVTINHTWNKIDDYLIRCKAKDTYDAESNWTYYEVEISRTRSSSYSWYEWLFERFPMLEKLLNLMR